MWETKKYVWSAMTLIFDSLALRRLTVEFKGIESFLADKNNDASLEGCVLLCEAELLVLCSQRMILQ